MNHELKTDPEMFQALIDGEKTYELRKDDRGFQVGDTLTLRETVNDGADIALGAPLEYTGRILSRVVTHVLRGPIYGLVEGWAILSFARFADAEFEIGRLQDLLFERGAMRDAPCFACGYNGRGYYQSDTHPCASRHHALLGSRTEDEK